LARQKENVMQQSLSNANYRQEILDAQERIKFLDSLIQRKEAFEQKLDKILLEIEQEETEIALVEKQLRPYRVAKSMWAKQIALSQPTLAARFARSMPLPVGIVE
jgi:hypothetical protein